MLTALALLTTFVWGAGQAQSPAESNTPTLLTNVKLNDPLKGAFEGAETTLQDQTDVAVTVYNNNLALVRDRRKVSLYPGNVSLRFADVAQQIRPETVSLQSISEPGAIHILEQNYEYDLMSPSKLMEKYVGKKVRLVNLSTEISFNQVEAQLLSVNEGPIYQVGNDIYLGYPGQVVLPEIPENLIAKPSLIWLLDNDGTDHEIEVTYLTGGIDWRADYVIALSRDDTTMDLTGWVTLNNQSGATYTNAQLKVVAGEVNIAPTEMPQKMMRGRGVMEAAIAPAPMQEEAFAEYHLYTLPRRTTIKENQSKQVNLLSASGIRAKKVYELRGDEQVHFRPVPPVKDQKVTVFLVFDNKKDNQLGIPVPAGVMRIYQEDSEGMRQFAGEDRVKHTPKDETIRIRMGQAFDIVGERVQTDYQRVADNVHESAFEIKVRNHKQNDITVDIVEPLMGDWEILKKSHDFVKKDAQTAVFSVAVPKDGETVVTYRVRVKY
jgi:hypothetical protein